MSPLPARNPTIADVARHAGVSIATVSRVINGNTLVIPETAERVRATIEELNYVPRTAARILASRRTNTIGLLLPEISEPFFLPLLRGIEAEVREAGFDLLIHSTHAPRPGSTPSRALGEHNTDGLIIFIDSIEVPELTRLDRLGFPIVLLYQTPPQGLDIPVITIENKSGAQKLVEHLIEVHNCHQIAFLQGPEDNDDSEWRERGYREALEGHGVPFDPALVARGSFEDTEAYEAVQQWILNGVEMDAIFAGDDDSAIGALQALRQAGKRVPEDIPVVGFDDMPFSRYLTPPLTTVRAPTEQVGRESVRQLLRRIRGLPADPLILLPTELVIRESCGCPPTLQIPADDEHFERR